MGGVALPGIPADAGVWQAKRGDAFEHVVQLAGQDTTDWVTLAQVRERANDVAVQATFTVDTAYGGHVDRVRLTLDETQMRALRGRRYECDFKKLDPDRTFFTFILDVRANVSREEGS